ncbi:transcriptional regulator FtrA [Shinella sp. CPCC 101442]|uniref:transcriptional regulator FtrA n=1 Tax=Shinella sp. CPCC 101442 TaxID=2932265 RepID=UPI002152BDED|nr:transcriptional regulator FtrA [Shinella sp. CPCC 101442]MCR6501820.1 transcriptional regulator FtrA [Shinella sp. CPCC 101442]
MTNAISRQPIANPLVVALAYDQLCTFEFGIATEIFALPRPEMGPNWYRFAVAGLDEGEMRSTGGLRFAVDGGLDLLAEAGTIVIPGWRGIDAPVPHVLIAALQAAHARGARILSFCSGVFVLAAAGLLDGRRATTHWRYTDTLTQRFPNIAVTPDVLYVDAGNVLTSAGTAAGLDLCLHLIRRDFGTEAANLVARRLVMPAHRDGGQAQFIRQVVPRSHESTRLGPLLDHMREHLGADHTVATLARRAGMSDRTFLRRFESATGMTPARWLLVQRLGKARDLLEETSASIEEIAALSGFGTTGTLRHHFRLHLSTTPVAYREAFGRQAATTRQ